MSGVQEVLDTGAVPGTTISIASTDSAVVLTDAALYRGGVASTYEKDKVVAVLISVETADIRIGWGITPNPATPLGHPVKVNSEIMLTCWSQAYKFKHVREGSTSAVLQVTPFFK